MSVLLHSVNRWHFLDALDLPCPDGHALTGSSCWTFGDPPRLALCATRINLVADPEEVPVTSNPMPSRITATANRGGFAARQALRAKPNKTAAERAAVAAPYRAEQEDDE